jgi:hypothetical protein
MADELLGALVQPAARLLVMVKQPAELELQQQLSGARLAFCQDLVHICLEPQLLLLLMCRAWL